LYLDAMSDVLGSTSKVLVDVDESSPLMVLPLNDLLGGGAQQAAQDEAEEQSGQAAEIDPYSLERMRNEQQQQNSGIRREGR
ncbi:hypothetical protein Q2357_20275, partial [Proteus mirabilis]|nr:hypothetical protein [Proteus mirabilis]